MLDRPTHRLIVGSYVSGWQGGYMCTCTCGEIFLSHAAGKRHLNRVWRQLWVSCEYEEWDMSNERIEVVKEVNMFPVLHVHWDRYTDDIIPADEESRVLLEAYRNN